MAECSPGDIQTGNHRGSIISKLYSTVDPNFVLNSDAEATGEVPPFSFGHGGHFSSERSSVNKINSKLSVFYQGRLYGRIEVTAKCARSGSNAAGIHLLDILVQELVFYSSHLCKWHSHPNIVQYHGLVFFKESGENVPYLLSERVKWNLQTILEDQGFKLDQKKKVSIIHDIASGLNFLHSRKPAAIVHAALVPSSVLLNSRGEAKLTNFFHTGKVNDKLSIKSKDHLPLSKHTTIKDGMKLQTSLDMLSLGYIVKAVDVEHRNREQLHRRNILEDFYVLYDCENGPPEQLNASEVCRKIASYLNSPHQSHSRDAPETEVQAQTSVSICHIMELYKSS